MRGVVVVEQLAELFGQVVDAVMDLEEMIDELEDHLDAGQVDPQVALIAHDRPEPANLRGLVADFRAPS